MINVYDTAITILMDWFVRVFDGTKKQRLISGYGSKSRTQGEKSGLGRDIPNIRNHV